MSRYLVTKADFSRLHDKRQPTVDAVLRVLLRLWRHDERCVVVTVVKTVAVKFAKCNCVCGDSPSRDVPDQASQPYSQDLQATIRQACQVSFKEYLNFLMHAA